MSLNYWDLNHASNFYENKNNNSHDCLNSRTRGIVHSVIETGTARLLFDNDFTHFWVKLFKLYYSSI